MYLGSCHVAFAAGSYVMAKIFPWLGRLGHASDAADAFVLSKLQIYLVLSQAVSLRSRLVYLGALSDNLDEVLCHFILANRGLPLRCIMTAI